MTEQWVRAYAIPADDLFDLVGSRDLDAVREVLGHEDLVEEVDMMLGEGSDLDVEAALGEIIGGNLARSHVYAYARSLEVILEARAARLSPDQVTLSRGGWRALRSSFSTWGLPTIGARWFAPDFRFPWRDPSDGIALDWPVPMLVRANELEAARDELRNKGVDAIAKHGLPSELAGLEAEATALLTALAKWLDAGTKRAGVDVVLFLDGEE